MPIFATILDAFVGGEVSLLDLSDGGLQTARQYFVIRIASPEGMVLVVVVHSSRAGNWVLLGNWEGGGGKCRQRGMDDWRVLLGVLVEKSQLDEPVGGQP